MIDSTAILNNSIDSTFGYSLPFPFLPIHAPYSRPFLAAPSNPTRKSAELCKLLQLGQVKFSNQPGSVIQSFHTMDDHSKLGLQFTDSKLIYHLFIYFQSKFRPTARCYFFIFMGEHSVRISLCIQLLKCEKVDFITLNRLTRLQGLTTRLQRQTIDLNKSRI